MHKEHIGQALGKNQECAFLLTLLLHTATTHTPIIALYIYHTVCTVYIGIAMVLVFSPYISFCFQFQLLMAHVKTKDETNTFCPSYS